MFVAAGATEGGVEFVTEVCKYSDHVTGQRVRVSRHSYNHHIHTCSKVNLFAKMQPYLLRY